MSEASAGGGGRTEIERRLIQRSMEDEEFRQRLLDDPKGTAEQELETQLSEDVEVRVLQESPQSIYLVLPSASRVRRRRRTLRRGALGGGRRRFLRRVRGHVQYAPWVGSGSSFYL